VGFHPNNGEKKPHISEICSPTRSRKKEESNIFHLQPQHHRNLSQKLTSSLQIETQYPPEKRKNEPSEGLLKSISAKC